MIYSSSILSKTNLPIPLFCDGTSMHSKYDPEKESSQFGDTLQSDIGCVLVAGIGAGYHISSLIAKKPSLQIIACEYDKESLEFCMQFPLVNSLSKKDTVIFCTIESVEKTIISTYLPAVHGGFAFLPQRVWMDKTNQNTSLPEIVQKALSAISADYSVQTHFGRLWQRNILLNVQQINGISIHAPDNRKTAAIIAAGPSLDNTVSLLKDKRSDYYIISTDTAYGTLLLNNISPDVVISVDGQPVSKTHFYICPNKTKESYDTLFVFDLCASPEAVQLVRSRGYKSFFIQSGHPLSSIASKISSIPYLNTGSGTVTIAACDWARLIGFTKIKLFGADFSYSNGKPYAKGTYLDRRFYTEDSRLQTAENFFDALLFRTPLLAAAQESDFSGVLKNRCTTEVLVSYRKTLLEWAASNSFEHSGGGMFTAKVNAIQAKSISQNSFAYDKFAILWKQFIDQKTYCSLFPYIAWMKKFRPECCKLPFFDLVKLAYSEAVRYTKKHE